MANIQLENYFSLHILLLKLSGLRLEPFPEDMPFVKRLLVVVVSVSLVILLPVLYVIGEALDAPHLELEELTFNLSYCITHSLGKEVDGLSVTVRGWFAGLIKILIFTYKRKQIWNFCRILETGRMKPNRKRGGDVEFKYVSDAVKLADRQAYFFHGVVLLVLSMRAIATHSEHLDYLKKVEELERRNATAIPPPGTSFLSYIPFEHSKTPLYQMVCAYQLFNAWLYGIYIGSIDTILTGFMIHAKAQFLILKNLLGHIVEKAEELYVTSRELPVKRCKPTNFSDGRRGAQGSEDRSDDRISRQALQEGREHRSLADGSAEVRLQDRERVR